MNEINDYLSKADEEIAKGVMYRVYGMPGPLFMENEVIPTPEPEPSFNIPFYVENITNETETLTIAGTDWSDYLEFPVEYSIDGTNWSLLGTTGETPLTRTLQPGDKVYLRATTNGWAQINEGKGKYTITGVSKVGGNIMSLLYGSAFTGNETTFPSNSYTYQFHKLFYSNQNLIDASELNLPVTTLTEECYEEMFSGCTALTIAPQILPAITLAQSCYAYMFSGCTALTTSPRILSATTLAASCCICMFNGCTSLVTTPVLPATTLAEDCYDEMFCECTALTTAPALPATTLAEGCYSDMFRWCTSFTTAPELPATTLTYNCYGGMFENCTSLTTAPELPATTLAESCYSNMFNGCTSLNEVTIYANDIPVEGCLNSWLYDVASNGQFHNLGTATFSKSSNSGCPSGWVADQPEYIIDPI